MRGPSRRPRTLSQDAGEGRGSSLATQVDAELACQLAPHAFAWDHLPRLPPANGGWLDAQEEPKLHLGQVSGFAQLAYLVHSGCSITRPIVI